MLELQGGMEHIVLKGDEGMEKNPQSDHVHSSRAKDQQSGG